MCRTVVHCFCVSLLLAACGTVQGAVFSDGFETSHDFLADGVAGTSWDGFIGSDPGQTVAALNASMARPGQLYLESAGAYYHEPWNPLGPFLYKVVEGDFVATVKVTDYAGTAAAPVYHNNCGLMARAFPEDAGAGEDWVALDYFPIWSCGNFVRSADDNVRTENGNNGRQWNLDPWLQVERRGNTFHFRTSADGVTWTAMSQSPLTRNDLADVPLQVGVYQATYSTDTGYAAFDEFKVEGPQVVPGMKAYNPHPADRATDVLRDIGLSWEPAETAAAHDVYFGTVLDDVANAGRDDPLDVLVGRGQDANTYDPVAALEFGRTYYWRVDEVRDDGVTVDRGDLWTFTVEPYAYPVANVAATASSTNSKDMGPEKTVDGSGLNAAGEHSTDAKTMWLSAKTGPQPTWIQYAFDRTCKLDRMSVWNSNQLLEPVLGFGVKDVTIEHSLDGAAWTALGDFEFAQAPSIDTYVANTTVDFSGVVAKYVRLTMKSNWGGVLPQYSLSEVRFFYVPVSAREPQPAPGAAEVDPQVTLSWRAGREAASHEVYLSTDQQAVIDETVPAVTAPTARYETAVDLATTYYWKVVEVNEAKIPDAWAGDVWSFTTAEYVTVDDFESYTDDEGGRIYETWLDGWEDPQNGSQVGYSEAPFTEQVTVNRGRQAMPLAYDNSAGAVYSEARRTFAAPQDWTRHGITTLVLYFHGRADNTAAPLYVKVNDTKVLYNDGAAATALPLWKQWNIDLGSSGANLGSVRSLTIGVGDGKAGGTGTVFIDDILLYATAPAVVTPTDPGPGALIASYAMEGNVQDGSGKGNHGNVLGDAAYEDAPAGRGKAITFNGTNTCVELPIGTLITTLTDTTISMWANFPNVGGAWQRIFDFGSGTTSYMFLTPRTGTAGPMRFAIRTATVGEQIVNAPATLPSDWHHVAVAIDSATQTVTLYLDGAPVAAGATALLPRDLGNTTQNWLGRSQFAGDAFYTGSLDEFRLYNRVLSESQVRYLAGDR